MNLKNENTLLANLQQHLLFRVVGFLAAANKLEHWLSFPLQALTV